MWHHITNFGGNGPWNDRRRRCLNTGAFSLEECSHSYVVMTPGLFLLLLLLLSCCAFWRYILGRWDAQEIWKAAIKHLIRCTMHSLMLCLSKKHMFNFIVIGTPSLWDATILISLSLRLNLIFHGRQIQVTSDKLGCGHAMWHDSDTQWIWCNCWKKKKKPVVDYL